MDQERKDLKRIAQSKLVYVPVVGRLAHSELLKKPRFAAGLACLDGIFCLSFTNYVYQRVHSLASGTENPVAVLDLALIGASAFGGAIAVGLEIDNLTGEE